MARAVEADGIEEDGCHQTTHKTAAEGGNADDEGGMLEAADQDGPQGAGYALSHP